MKSQRWIGVGFIVTLIPVLCLMGIAAIAAGSTHVEWSAAAQTIGARLLPFGFDASQVSRADQVIIWDIRLPRAIVAAFVGAGLAVAGALLQGLFRNPLAEPSIVGVAPGAVLGAVVAFVTGLASRSPFFLPIASSAGALIALGVIYAMATRGGRTPVATLLLSGIAMGAFFGAFSQLLISLNMVNWYVAQEIVFWQMGGLDSRTWTHVYLVVPFILLAIAISLYYSRDLDLLLQGEESAAALGVNVESTKRAVMLLVAILTGSSVAVAGIVAFAGLIVPHIVRICVGPSHRMLLPSSALAGSVFLLFCDLLARTLRPPTEIRLGIITAVLGAPFFVFLLVRKYREVR
jgi:iron complex transport system permease protein